MRALALTAALLLAACSQGERIVVSEVSTGTFEETRQCRHYSYCYTCEGTYGTEIGRCRFQFSHRCRGSQQVSGERFEQTYYWSERPENVRTHSYETVYNRTPCG